MFDDLESQYNEIDNYYAAAEFNARSDGDAQKESIIQEKRKINDQAYFVFIFSRFEDHVKNECATLVSNCRSLALPANQMRVWLHLPTDFRDYQFMRCAALLSDKGGSDYNLVKKYYDERNSIAHGGNFISPISMPTAIPEIKRLSQELCA